MPRQAGKREQPMKRPPVLRLRRSMSLAPHRGQIAIPNRLWARSSSSTVPFGGHLDAFTRDRIRPAATRAIRQAWPTRHARANSRREGLDRCNVGIHARRHEAPPAPGCAGRRASRSRPRPFALSRRPSDARRCHAAQPNRPVALSFRERGTVSTKTNVVAADGAYTRRRMGAPS